MEGNSKDSFIFDTSALISLGSIKLIEDVLKISNIFICQSVIRELNDFARFDDNYGKAGKECLKYKNKFVVLIPIIKEEIEFIEGTDNEVYNLAKEKNLPLITDDIKLSRHLEGKINIYFSTFFLSALVSCERLTKENALNMLEDLCKERNWQNNIIYSISKQELEKIDNRR